MEEEGDPDQADPKWLSHLPLTTSMGSMDGAFQGPRGYQTTPIYIRWVTPSMHISTRMRY